MNRNISSKLSKALMSTAAVFILLVCAVPSVSALPYSSYTYSRKGEYMGAPNPYRVTENIILKDAKGTPLNFPSDFHVTEEGELLIADTQNHRVICFDRSRKEKWQLNSFTSGNQTVAIESPTSVIEGRDGYYYITDQGPKDDKGNSLGEGRIFKFDKKLSIVEIFGKPNIKILEKDGKSYQYAPLRIAVDFSGRMYVIARNINQGFIQLNKKGEFQGFLGAPSVEVDLWQLLMRSFSTKAQLERMSSFVPTEYGSVDMDSEGFLYSALATANTEDTAALIMRQQTAGNTSGGPAASEILRRLNPSGVDVLRRKSGFSPVGDLRLPGISIAGAPIISSEISRGTDSYLEASKFADVKEVGNGIYFALDSYRSRVFAYDYDGNLLFIFGGTGQRAQSFSEPIAIEYWGEQILLLNRNNSSISVCEPTEYGRNLIMATRYQQAGKYDEAKSLWESVLIQNTNCEQAYNALGKLYLNENDLPKALSYFKLADNRSDYSKAFQYSRSNFADKYFLPLAALVILFPVFIFYVIKLMKKAAAGEGRLALGIAKINYAFYSTTHPFDGFYEMKHRNRGSAALATVLFFVFGVSSILSTNGSGFIFNKTNPRYTNLVLDLSAVLLPFLLCALANWCLTTLMDGKGTFKDIYISIAVCTIPAILSNFFIYFLSFALTGEEAMIMSMISALGTVWMVFLLFCASVSVHDYSAGKSVLTLILSLVGVVLIVFIALFFISIVNQCVDFVKMISKDLSMR